MRTNVRYLVTIGMAALLVISAAPSLLTAQARPMLAEPDTSALAAADPRADSSAPAVRSVALTTSSSVALRRHSLSRDSVATLLPAPAPRVEHGSALALMGVGAGAAVVGLLVGGDAGAVVAIGGGVVALVGLYRYLR